MTIKSYAKILSVYSNNVISAEDQGSINAVIERGRKHVWF